MVDIVFIFQFVAVYIFVPIYGKRQIRSLCCVICNHDQTCAVWNNNAILAFMIVLYGTTMFFTNNMVDMLYIFQFLAVYITVPIDGERQIRSLYGIISNHDQTCPVWNNNAILA
jgi:hypothetical protein